MAAESAPRSRASQGHLIGMADDTTIVHLLRHGEVHNPEGILYGRLPDFHLSERGQEMAQQVAQSIRDRDVTYIVSSPLERAQETAAPIAAAHGLSIATDARVIEADNIFEGQRVGVGDGVLRQPKAWRHLWNPFTPSWGEPYDELADRMHGAIRSARDEARGLDAVVVTHMLPLSLARVLPDHRGLWQAPRRRECSLASLTSLHFEGDRLAAVEYGEPAAALLPGAKGRGA